MFTFLFKALAFWSIAVLASPLPQIPTGEPGDKTAPDAALGEFLAGAGNVTLGPAPKGCSNYELIVARGTGEPGPFGVIVGDPLVTAVVNALPDARGYAVQYPASFDLQYSPQIGMDDVIDRLNKQSKDCPDQTFAIIGYSQGAGVWHSALGPSPGAALPGLPPNRPKLDTSVLPKIKAAVMFGDPGFKGTEGPTGYSPPFPDEITAVLRQNCAPGDLVCDPAGTAFEKHLTYVAGSWQTDSVAFVLAGFKGKVLPKAPRSANDTDWIAMSAKARTESRV